MNDDVQPNAKGESQSGSSASYNPTTAHATHNEPASGGNLVRDLMSVYESLTQSKTPQTSAQQHDYQQQQQPLPHQYPHQQQHPQYPHGPPGSNPQQLQQQQVSTTFSIPPNPYQVPPPPPYPPTQQGGATSHQAQPYYTDHSYGQQQQPYNVVPAPEHAQQQQQAYPVPGSAPPPPVGSAHVPGGSLPSADQEDEDENDSEGADEATNSRARRKRRGSDVSNTSGKGAAKSRKKSKKASDGRWSKRFTWPEDLHRDFVSAIFDVGLKHSSPSTILEHMPKHEQITAERIKSHLQKYRMHRLKSKKEFISSYESSLRNFQARGLTGAKSISSGEVAAHLTYSSLGEGGRTQSKPTIPKPEDPQPTGDSSKGGNTQTQQQQQQNDALMLPQLTDAEKQSPIGAAMGYLMGLFFSLKQQLMIQRAIEAGAKSKNNAPVQAVFNSFVSGNTTSPARQTIPSVPPGSTETGQNVAGGHPGSQPQQAVASNVLSAPSVRTNIEENSMMKQEMQNQMGLQRKMRALKQQELNKYKSAPNSQQHENATSASGAMTTRSGEEAKDHQHQYHQHHHNVQHSSMPTKEEEAAAAHPAATSTSEATAGRNTSQGAGEPPGNDSTAPLQRSRQQSLSVGASDDFWNTDVVDEQLFEFLMNN